MKLKTERCQYSCQKSYILAQLLLVLLRSSTRNVLGKPQTNVECYLYSQIDNFKANEFKLMCNNQFQNCFLYIEWPKDGYAAYAIEDLPPFDLLIKNCSNTGIIKDKIEQLDLSYSRIAIIPTNYFCSFKNLSHLALFSNELSESDSYGFAPDCESRLATLDMQHNEFLALRNFSFVGSPNLVELDLSINRISKIAEFTFHKLDRLQRLNLSKNKLHSISPGAFQPLSSLQKLDLSNNKLNDTSVIDFGSLVSLQFLNLENNKYRTINAGLFMGLTRLETLLLSTNNIKAVPGAFSSLTSLVVLDVSSNYIVSITDAGLSNLRNLSKLYLSTNRIMYVPKETFCSNNNLITLDLRSNKITDFPDISLLEKLQILLLSANLMSELSLEDLKVFCHLRYLQKLDLGYNYIASIEPGMFDCLKNLQELKFHNNLLTSIHGLLNVTDLKIKSLTFYSNNITDVTFDEIPWSVVTFNISRNAVKQFPTFREDVRRNLSLRMLDLSFNPIHGIVQITELPVHLEYLNLSGNNIDFFSILTGLEHRDNDFTLKSVNLCLNYLFLVCQPLLLWANKKIPIVELAGNKLACDCEIDFIHRQIKRYPIIKGRFKLFNISEAQLLGPNSTLLDVTQVPNPEDFLCQAPQTGSVTHQCNTHSTYNAKCELPCPDVCSCYLTNKFDTQLINCSNRGLSQVPIMKPSYLQVTLNLSFNSLESLTSAMLTSYPNLHVLHLDHNHLRSIDSNALQAVPQLTHLNLQHNQLSSILPRTFDSLPNLLNLDIAFNLLAYIPDDIFQPLHSIRHLRLHDNLLSNFSVWQLGHLDSVDLLQVTLRDNPWSCDCDYIEQFRSWLQNYSKVVLDISQVYCTSSDGIVANTPLISFNASYCYDTSGYPVLMGNIPALASTLAFLVFLSLSAVLVFIYRKEMQVLVYSRYGIRLMHTEDEATDKKYDGFLAYSSLDSDFVVEKLLPKLEQIEKPYKLCLHERDFMVGSYISESILDAVATSHRTIILLSENFASSNWCRFEFLMAHFQMLNDKSNRVIVILLGQIPDQLDPEMKLYLKTNTYLKWGDRLFWEKLYYALPNRIPKKEENVY